MIGDQYLKILGRLNRAEAAQPGESHLCSVAVDVIGCQGASISLRNAVGAFNVLCASSPAARALVEWETTTGEGPCTDACLADDVIRASSLDVADGARWPLYAPLALSQGARAVFGFPIRIGVVRLGALLVAQTHTGELTSEQSSSSHLMASVIARATLALQSGVPLGSLAQEIENAVLFDTVVQQAAGMVSVQGSLSLSDALVLLHAHSFASGMTSSALAQRIVARHIRYDADTWEWVEGGPASDPNEE